MSQRAAAPLLAEDARPGSTADPGVRDVALVPAGQTSGDLVLMFERLAKDPAVDVEKLQRLIDMQKDILRVNAEAEFWAAFAEMQGALPTITEDGSIAVNGAVRSRYSTNENIQECIRPILKQYGFALSFRNSTTEKGQLIRGILAHRGGHKETDDFESPPDSGGQMNNIQRIGSTRSYGQRYTTIALLNIVSRAPQDRDDDGQGSERPAAPDGYEAFAAVLEAKAEEGLPALTEAFNGTAKAKPALTTYLTKHFRREWEAMKAKAAKVKVS
jgi:hypothetical protein